MRVSKGNQFKSYSADFLKQVCLQLRFTNTDHLAGLVLLLPTGNIEANRITGSLK